MRTFQSGCSALLLGSVVTSALLVMLVMNHVGIGEALLISFGAGLLCFYGGYFLNRRWYGRNDRKK
jgi:hypothetical protein